MNANRLFLSAAGIALVMTCLHPARAATIGLAANISHQPTPGGGNATRVNGDGLIVNNSLNSFIQLQIAVTTSWDNLGVAQIVYDVVSPEAKAKGYFLDDVNQEGNTGAYRAYSGYNNHGGPAMPQDISAPFYQPQPSPVPPSDYGGGWGWTNSGLPHWGRTADNPGSVLGAGDSLPLTWSGDIYPAIAGNQTFARMGIGLGSYAAAPEDPVLAGQTLGFGTDIANGIGGGDGFWWFHTILIDTTGWDEQTYTFNLQATAGNVLRTNDAGGNPIDYSQPLGGGFRQAVTGSDLQGTSISFTLIPEPGTLAFVLLGALALVRRRC